MITRFIDGYKKECESGATHPLGRLAMTLGLIGMMFGATFDNPDGGTPLLVTVAVISVALLCLWVSVTMDAI